MNKMFTAFIGLLLLALQLSSQVQAQTPNSTDSPMNSTMMANYTMPPTVSVGTSGNATVTKGASASLRADACALLFPVALVASVVHGRF